MFANLSKGFVSKMSSMCPSSDICNSFIQKNDVDKEDSDKESDTIDHTKINDKDSIFKLDKQAVVSDSEFFMGTPKLRSAGEYLMQSDESKQKSNLKLPSVFKDGVTSDNFITFTNKLEGKFIMCLIVHPSPGKNILLKPIEFNNSFRINLYDADRYNNRNTVAIVLSDKSNELTNNMMHFFTEVPFWNNIDNTEYEFTFVQSEQGYFIETSNLRIPRVGAYAQSNLTDIVSFG